MLSKYPICQPIRLSCKLQGTDEEEITPSRPFPKNVKLSDEIDKGPGTSTCPFGYLPASRIAYTFTDN